MKFIFLAVLTFSSSSIFAQSMTVPALAALMTEKKAMLEKVNPGMTKKLTTSASLQTTDGWTCNYTQTTIQTVLKIEGSKMIILSQEEFTPEVSNACSKLNLEGFKEKILFYETKPSLQEDLTELQASEASSIMRSGDLITMMVNGKTSNPDGSTVSEVVTVKYDLSKPSFKNLVSTETKNYKAIMTDMADTNLGTVDLKQVVFCASADSQDSECVEGDFSDILF